MYRINKYIKNKKCNEKKSIVRTRTQV